MDKTAKEAVEQIRERKYLQPYEADSRQKVVIGINFSSKLRAVEDYSVAKVD